MSPFGCTREKEVAELLDRGQWPQASPEELRAHAGACRSCSELILTKQAFRQARAAAMSMPTLPSPSALWWRAQLRKRNEAIERINRPILGAQIFALAIVALAAVGGLLWQLRHGFDLADWFRQVHLDTLWPSSLGNFAGGLWFVVPVLAALAIVSGLVVYFASEKQ
jgi:hypothetical protein